MAVRLPLALLAALGAALLLLGPAQGAFPGANGVIAYTCGGKICVVNPDGTNGTTLIASGVDPAWSPGGSKLAYSNGGSVYTANADGTNSVDFADQATQPTWSNDGLTIAFIDGDGHVHIKSPSSSTPLTSTADYDPAISPDGTTIVYDDLVNGNFQLFKISTSGGTATQLTNDPNDHISPAWSPDGSTIVYENGSGLAKIPATGSMNVTPTQVTTADSHDPAYSPDGTKIVYADGSGGGGLDVIAASLVNGTSADATQIVAPTALASSPDWGSAALLSSGGGGSSTPSDTANGPTNTSYPVITLASGDSTPVVGHSLFASAGTWSGTFPISYSYQWKRCDPGDPVNGSCFTISGATSSFYTPTPTDYGMRLRVAVSATNPDGRHTQNSEVTAPTIALAPKNTATPPITPGGTNRVDQALSVATGTWSGSTPIAYTYSWRRCDPVGDLSSCVAIGGATSSTYTPTLADIGFSLRVWITGTNVAGSDVVITNHTFPILDKLHFAPTVANAPAIGGTALPGRQLTANIGTYNGDTPVATSFGWYRCNAVGAQCHAIPGAKKVTYFPTQADVGYTIEIIVHAANAYGKLVVASPATDTVAAEPPHVKGRRIVGTNKADYLAGGGHDDVILGRGGNDTILGGAGDDLLEGGAGNDVITGGPGADRIFGGPGSDTIYAADGEKDVVDCGPGDDRVIADPYDVVKNCEVVTRVTQPATATWRAGARAPSRARPARSQGR